METVELQPYRIAYETDGPEGYFAIDHGDGKPYKVYKREFTVEELAKVYRLAVPNDPVGLA